MLRRPLALLLLLIALSARPDHAEERPSATDTTAATPPEPVRVGLNPNGGGVFVEGEGFYIRMLGYAQANFTAYDGALDRSDANGDFFLRRTRLDVQARFQNTTTLFIEIDGAPGTGTSTDSDFGLIEAYGDIAVDEALHVRAGKYIVPVSAENLRSSRSIETVERYGALNSLFLLPGLDTQFGVMAYGRFGPDDRLGYYAGVFNGNGSANANFSDANGNKELVGRLTYSHPALQLGASVDYTVEAEQTLSIADLGFNRFVSVPIEGTRIGGEADLFVTRGALSLRAEGLLFRFDTPGGGDTAGLVGGYVQPGVFLRGDETGGLQLLARADVTHLDADTGPNGDTMLALLGGVNWYLNGNTRVQANAIAHRFDGPSELRGFDDTRWSPMLQTELQIKF